jgi:hypothetical protein
VFQNVERGRLELVQLFIAQELEFVRRSNWLYSWAFVGHIVNPLKKWRTVVPTVVVAHSLTV